MKKKSRFINFKQLKEQVSIKQILKYYSLLDNLTGKGDTLSGYCPVCEGEADDLFRVSISKNCWNCFGDCSGGNILDFVSQMEECTIREAGLKIAEWFSIECTPKKRSPRKSAKKSHRPPKKKSSSSCVKEKQGKPSKENKPLGFTLELDSRHAYFDELCLSEETIEEYGLGYCPKGFLKGYIAFPIHNMEGEIVAYGGMSLNDDDPMSPEYKYPTEGKFNSSLELFGLHHVLKRGQADVIYWVRSPMEVFRAWHDDGISAVCFLAKPSDRCIRQSVLRLWECCLVG